jgi:hypothetical protein
VAEAGMGSAQHLERSPLKPGIFEPGLHVPALYVIPPQRGGRVLRSEYPRLRLLAHQFHPTLQARGRLGRNSDGTRRGRSLRGSISPR